MASAKEMLLSQLSDPGAKSKITAKLGGFIRDRLREASYTEQVLPGQTVDKSECQVSVNHDSLVKIEYLEPKSRASVVTFRGEPNTTFIRGEKVEIPFFTIMSDMYQKPEQEFLAYPYPIGRVVEQNSVQDIGEIQDREFTTHTEAGVQALQAEANGGSATALNASGIQAGTVLEYSVVKGELARGATTNDATVRTMQRPDLVALMKLLDANRLTCDMFLMTTVDWDDLLTWTVQDNGDKIQSETGINGWKWNVVLGKRYIRSLKTDILRPGNVYAFTSPDFLGRFYILNNIKFYIDKVINMIKFVAWKDVAMSIVNIASVRKLELYSGDAASTNADGVLASVTPKAEEDLGAENNRAAQRQFFPSVVSF